MVPPSKNHNPLGLAQFCLKYFTGFRIKLEKRWGQNDSTLVLLGLIHTVEYTLLYIRRYTITRLTRKSWKHSTWKPTNLCRNDTPINRCSCQSPTTGTHLVKLSSFHFRHIPTSTVGSGMLEAPTIPGRSVETPALDTARNDGNNR